MQSPKHKYLDVTFSENHKNEFPNVVSACDRNDESRMECTELSVSSSISNKGT